MNTARTLTSRLFTSGLAAAAIGLATLAGPAAAQQKSSADLLQDFMAAFGKGNVAAMVEAHAPDAIFITPMGTLKGRDQIRGAIEAVIAEFGKPGAVFKVVSTSAEGPVAQLIWQGESSDNVYEFAAETYVFVDGRIAEHTFAAKVMPKAR